MGLLGGIYHVHRQLQLKVYRKVVPCLLLCLSTKLLIQYFISRYLHGKRSCLSHNENHSDTWRQQW